MGRWVPPYCASQEVCHRVLGGIATAPGGGCHCHGHYYGIAWGVSATATAGSPGLNLFTLTVQKHSRNFMAQLPYLTQSISPFANTRSGGHERHWKEKNGSR